MAKRVKTTIREAITPSQLFGSADEPAFPSQPENATAAARSGGDGRRGATRSHAQRALRREHGEDGEHRTFPEVSTAAHSNAARRSAEASRPTPGYKTAKQCLTDKTVAFSALFTL